MLFFRAFTWPKTIHKIKPVVAFSATTGLQGVPRSCRFGSIRLNLVKQGGHLGQFRVHSKKNARAHYTPGNLKRTYWFKGIYAFSNTAGKKELYGLRIRGRRFSQGLFAYCYHVVYFTLKLADCQTVLHGHFQQIVHHIERGHNQNFVAFDNFSGLFNRGNFLIQ